MAQIQYSTYQIDILSFELRDALIGILKPGRYLGYNGMSEYQVQVGNDVYCAIEQEDPISKYDQQDPPVLEAARGVAITTQGTIIAEDSDVQVTVTVTPANSSGIYHIVYMEHAYLSGTPGANPATYGVKSGVDGGGLPALQYLTKQVVIGVIFEAIGATSFSDLTYHPFHPDIGDSDLYSKLFRTTIYKTYAEGTLPTDGIIGNRQFPNNNYITDYQSITKVISDLDAAVKARADAITALAATKLDDWATPDDNTDLDASINEHGLLPKLPDDVDKYLNGVGGWAVPVGSRFVMRTGTFGIDITLTSVSPDTGQLDFGGIAPSGADVLILKVEFKQISDALATHCYMDVRVAATGGYNARFQYPYGNSLNQYGELTLQGMVPCDSSQKLYYNLYNKDHISAIEITCVGWQIPS